MLGVSVVEKILDLVFQNSPFGHISDNVYKIISDFFALDEYDNHSYNYQYLNGSYYPSLAYAICMWMVAKNVSSNNKIDLDNLELGEEIQYENQYYKYLGKVSKKNVSEEKHKIETIYEKYPVKRTLRRKDLENRSECSY